jgi:hypothetical protein
MEHLDDIAGRLTVAAIAFAVAGAVIAGFAAVALGSVRAAEKWPSAPRPRVGRGVALSGVMVGLIVFALAAGLFSLARIGTGLDVNLRVLIAVGIDLLALGIGLVAVNVIAGKVEVNALIAIPEHPVTPPPIPVSGEPTRYQVPDYTETPSDPDGPRYYGSPPAYDPTPPGPRMPAPDTSATSEIRGLKREGVPTIPTDTRPGWVFRDRGTGAYYAAVAQSRGGISLLALDDFTIARTAALVGPLELVGSVEATVWPLDDGAGADDGEATETDAQRESADS